jgi:hypothetical protein
LCYTWNPLDTFWIGDTKDFERARHETLSSVRDHVNIYSSLQIESAGSLPSEKAPYQSDFPSIKAQVIMKLSLQRGIRSLANVAKRKLTAASSCLVEADSVVGRADPRPHTPQAPTYAFRHVHTPSLPSCAHTIKTQVFELFPLSNFIR